MKKKIQKQYLTIGEVAKIMQVSKTSLRYYDEIGILKPAYTHEDTGYRYYSKNQLPLLSFIVVAIDLGIPLKDFKKYLQASDGINLEEFVNYAKENVSDSIKKLQRGLYFLNAAEKHFSNNIQDIGYQNNENEYTKQINERYFITLQYSFLNSSAHFDFFEYWKKLSELYAIIAKNELTFSIEQGIIFSRSENSILTRVFVEIKNSKKKIIEHAEIICIPQGDYTCSFYPDEYIAEATTKYFDHPSFTKGNILVVSDILDKQIGNKTMCLEVQLLTDK